jgi:hypothetical protein
MMSIATDGFNGEGVAKDYGEAYKWYLLATEFRFVPEEKGFRA